MILEEIKNIKSTKRELRNFGFAVGGVLLAVGLIIFFFGKSPIYKGLVPAGAFLIIFGLIFPRLLLPLQKVWMTFAVIMGFFMTRVILFITFFMVFTPFAIIGKIVRKDFIEKKIDSSAESYWHYADEEEPYEQKHTDRQF